MAGVDAAGFTKKTIEEIKKGIEDDLLTTIAPDLVLASNQPIGQIISAISRVAAEIWELAEVTYNGIDRNAAEGKQLDNVGALTGTLREAARKTRVLCTLDLGAAFSQPAGALMANVAGNPDLKFVNANPVTSTTAGSYTGILFESLADGPTYVNAHTLTSITNAVTGWNAIDNPEDGVPGAFLEEDGDYRIRQESELSAGGASTVDAIATDVLQVPGVQQASCYENVTMHTDSNGVPAKAIEVIVFDGVIPSASNDAIAQAIWESKPSGAEAVGYTSGTAVDSQGDKREVAFSRAIIRDIYLSYDVRVDASRFPIDGIQRIKEVAVQRGDARDQDDDVIALSMRAAPLDVPGVVDVMTLRLGFSSFPSGTANLPISVRERADFDTSRIIVNIFV